MCVYIPVMPLAISVHMCYDVASLRLVRAVRPLFRGDPVLYSLYICFGLIQTVMFYLGL